MTPEQILAKYGRIYPAWEYELADGQRTGRRRKRQYVSYPRPHDPKPIVTRPTTSARATDYFRESTAGHLRWAPSGLD